MKAKEHAMAKFKEFEEFKLATQDFEVATIKALRRFSTISSVNTAMSLIDSRERPIPN